VNIVAAPLAGAIFDAVGAHWLYLLSAGGYVIGALSLCFTKHERQVGKQEIVITREKTT
jgi:hypothetical protein